MLLFLFFDTSFSQINTETKEERCVNNSQNYEKGFEQDVRKFCTGKLNIVTVRDMLWFGNCWKKLVVLGRGDLGEHWVEARVERRIFWGEGRLCVGGEFQNTFVILGRGKNFYSAGVDNRWAFLFSLDVGCN